MIKIELLREMMEQGYVRSQKHPTADLWIYNYTALAQYEQVWNEVTLQCRGLILNSDYEIVARPFQKFFNLGEQEHQIIPKESFEVYEKMDGSLGILYWLNNKPYIATRGSFASKQSDVANEILQHKYGHLLDLLRKNKTYLFEIIYPENRIVVDYGDKRDIVLLAVVDTITGKEEMLEDFGFPVVKRFDGIHDIHALKALEEDNKEGFVIKFKSDLRYKVKFEEYVRIHRIITQVSSLSIWDYLITGQSLEEILERVPDEFYQWVKRTQAELLAQFKVIEDQCKQEFKVLETRKDTALYFQTCQYPSVLFSMLDEKDYRPTIWRYIRPEFEKPFVNEVEESKKLKS